MRVLRCGVLVGAAFALSAALIIGCGEDLKSGTPAGAAMVEYVAGDSCLSGTKKETDAYGQQDEAKVEVTVEGLTIFVTHKNAVFNCCLDSIVVDFSQDERRLVIRESEVVTHACHCNCDFEVSVTIEVPGAGTYLLEIWTGNVLVWSGEVEV